MDKHRLLNRLGYIISKKHITKKILTSLKNDLTVTTRVNNYNNKYAYLIPDEEIDKLLEKLGDEVKK